MKKTVTFLFFIMISCNSAYDYDSDNFEKYYSVTPESKKKIKIKNIELHKILLDSIPSSYIGNLSYRNDTIFFTDYRFCRIFLFTPSGKLIGKFLESGKGLNEVPTNILQAHVPLKNGSHFFMGINNDAYLFDKNFRRITQCQILRTKSQSEQEEFKHPFPDNQMLYDLCDDVIFKPRAYKDNVYFQIFSMHPKFNMVVDDYYKYSRIMAEMDMKSGKIKNLLGRRSPEYQKYKYLIYDFYSFDISKDKDFYISFPPDSLIYVYNKDFEQIKAFGIAGKNMNTKYKEVKTLDDVRNNWDNISATTDYYAWIEYFDKQNLLFRSYKKGSNDKTDGLQIYKNTVLIGDIDVPKNFRVEAYIKPFFYSNAFIDEENEKISLYKFRIDF